MKWGRLTDYHGSRAYECEEPTAGQAGFVMAWVADKARRMIETLLRFGARPTASTELLLGKERNSAPHSAEPAHRVLAWSDMSVAGRRIALRLSTVYRVAVIA